MTTTEVAKIVTAHQEALRLEDYSAKQLQQLISELSSFYSAWHVSQGKDIVKIAADYQRDREGLNKSLRCKYHGTDLTSSQESIARIQLGLDAQNAEIAKIEAALGAFYDNWSFTVSPAHSAYVHKMAVEYHGKESQLCTLLQENFHGTDLSWSSEKIAAKIKEISVKKPADDTSSAATADDTSSAAECIDEAATQRVKSELHQFLKLWGNDVSHEETSKWLKESDGDLSAVNSRLRAHFDADLSSSAEHISEKRHAFEELRRQLEVFYGYLNANKVHEVDAIVRKHNGNRNLLNNTLRQKYTVDLDSSEWQMRREKNANQACECMSVVAMPFSFSSVFASTTLLSLASLHVISLTRVYYFSCRDGKNLLRKC